MTQPINPFATQPANPFSTSPANPFGSQSVFSTEEISQPKQSAQQQPLYLEEPLIQQFDEILFQALHITDPHWNPLGKIPQSRTETYFEDESLEYQSLRAHLARHPGAPLLISGDLFNIKAQAQYSPESCNSYRERLSQLTQSSPQGNPIYTIPGNHDLPSSSLKEIQRSIYLNTTLLS